jgi:hypothetical protein
VCDQETLKNVEAKTPYRAVDNVTKWVVTPRKPPPKKRISVYIFKKFLAFYEAYDS